MFGRRHKSLKGKKCFITGAASGIGHATALLAAAEGAELFLTDINATRLEVAVAEIRGQGGLVSMSRALDVSDFDAVQAFAKAIHDAHGSMDVLMNIAGISVWGTVDELEHENWRNVIEINLMGPIHVIESFVGEMIKAGRGGHIVNVSSAAGLFGLPWHAAYSASKFGLRGVSEVLRFDLARYGIDVSLVCPGGVNTPLVGTVNIRGVDGSREDVQRMKARFQKHAATPEQAAAAIIRGIERRDYMIFTSLDIRVGYWFQRKFAFPYEVVMRILNDRFHALRGDAKPGAAARSGPSAELGSRGGVDSPL
jgi:NAD(P)-dependent dehydrogenase (short-subunit alcohol dehydrogenase family)